MSTLYKVFGYIEIDKNLDDDDIIKLFIRDIDRYSLNIEGIDEV